MRITKRPSGGRGEYEISETLGKMTPRDLLGRVLVLDLSGGIQIPTGVVLLDRNGKRRLRIDPSTGAEIHLHRQLAAALLMPHPARDENTWGAGQPVLQSGLYGIGNISLSDVQLIEGDCARLALERIDVANSAHREQLSCPRRFADVRAVWAVPHAFPPDIAQLLAEHEQLVRRGRPLGEYLEEIVARIQQALTNQNRVVSGVDPLPSLLQIIEAGCAQPSGSSVAEQLSGWILDAGRAANATVPTDADEATAPTQPQRSKDAVAAARFSESPPPTPPVQDAEPNVLPAHAADQEIVLLSPAVSEEPAAQEAEEERATQPDESPPAPVALAETDRVKVRTDQRTDVAPAESATQEKETRTSGGDMPAMPYAIPNQAAPIRQPTNAANVLASGLIEGHPAPLPAPEQQPAAPTPEPEPDASADQDDEGQEAPEGEEAALPNLSPTMSRTTPLSPPALRRRPARHAKIEAPPIPRRYQPAQRGGTPSRRPSTVASQAGDVDEPLGVSNQRPAPIELRLRKQRGGTVAVSLLPFRRDRMPAVVDVVGAGSSPLTLSALRDDWYQDVVPTNLGVVLRTGAEWYADTGDGRLRWSLPGRDLYVLGNNDEWSGPVSRPWLVLGDEHAVLCTEEIASQVEELLQQCCATVPVRVTEDDGLPAGWVAYRPVVPTKPLPLSQTPDIFDALRPSPDIEIALRGGIRLQYKQWLAGFPPAIRLYGDVEHAGTPAIDGIAAERQPDGACTVAAWDTVGDHVVACGGQTSSYSIVEPVNGWDVWTAYSFSSLTFEGSEPGICGALVFSSAPHRTRRPPVLIPASNPLLLGSVPGQIYRCPIQKDICLPFCVAFPGFLPIWAIPGDPLHADKRTTRVLHIRALDIAGSFEIISDDEPTTRKIRQWCAVILDCARKGLAVEPADKETGEAWRSCRNIARRIWRASR